MLLLNKSNSRKECHLHDTAYITKRPTDYYSTEGLKSDSYTRRILGPCSDGFGRGALLHIAPIRDSDRFFYWMETENSLEEMTR